MNDYLLTAMPSLENPEDFDMDEDESNIERTKLLLQDPSKRLKSKSGSLRLYQCIKPDNAPIRGGVVFLVDTNTMRSLYYMEYLLERFGALQGKEAATQVAVWVSKTNPRPPRNYATKITLVYLLRQFHYVLSDKMQTADGKRFWYNLMKTAAGSGNEVGLLDFQTNPAKDTQCIGDFDKWYKSVAYAYKRGSNDHMKYRFYIRSNLA